jgi:hypothetical protein
MSKRSLFWANATGKLGETVFYRAGGEQRNRSYVKNIKNPKSKLQATQRAKFNNMVGAYKALEIAVKSFFTQRNANQSPFNAFFKLNWPLNQWVATKEVIGRNEGIASGFYVSRGSVSVPTQLSVEGVEDSMKEEKFGLVMNIAKSGCAMPQGDKAFQSVDNGKKFYELLVGASNPYNLPAEFNVTVITCESGFVSMNATIYTMRCAADSQDTWKCLAYPKGTTAPSAANMAHLVEIANGEMSDNESAAGAWTGVTKLFVHGSLTSANQIDWGAAVIVSYKDAAGKQATNSAIAFGEGAQEYINDYLPTGESGKSIISQYEVASNLIE